jgi:hypothetical protein
MLTGHNVAWNVVITIPVIYFFFKETKGLSLEEIDLMFGDRALGALPTDLDEKKGGEAIVIVGEDRLA